MRQVAVILLTAALLCVNDAPSPAGADAKGDAFQVPYQLAATRHIVVRAKLNGHGPYNLVIDTGAPAIVLARKLAEPIGITLDDSRWADLKKLEIEGGVTLENVTARFDDLYQLEGMNGLGMAGVEIHGLIGYPLLARYRITFDFTKSKMTWVPLKARPDELPRRAGGNPAPGGLDALAGIMKALGSIAGANKLSSPKPRGFVGLSLEKADDGMRVSAVVPGGPADRAGLKIGDVIKKANNRDMKTSDDFATALSTLTAKQPLSLSITNGQGEREITFDLGEGL